MWGAALFGGQIAAARARRRPPGDELVTRRRLSLVIAVEHAAFLAALASGAALMAYRGWGLGHARWLALKLGLVLFLVVPLEGMHMYMSHGWIARGLRQTAAPPFARDLDRGLGVEEMLRALGIPLLGLGLPLLLWLSLAKPF